MIQKNHYLEKLSNNEISWQEEKLIEKLEKKYAPRPYSQVWRMSYNAVYMLSLVFNFYSLITGAFAVAYFMYLCFSGIGTFSALVLAFVLGVCSGVLLELIKRNNSTNLFQHAMVEGEWKSNGVVGMILLMGLSVSLSFYGSSKIPAASTPLPPLEQPIITDVAALSRSFDLQKQELTKNIEDLESKNSYKGKTARSVRDESAAMRLSLAQLHESKLAAITAAEARNREAIEAAEARNREAITAAEATTGNLGAALGYISIATELLFLLCMYYIEKYLYKCALERKESFVQAIQAVQNMPEQEPESGITHVTHQDEIPIPEQAPPVSADRARILGFVNKNKPADENATIHCTSDTRPTKTVTVFKKNTYTHMKEDGTSAEMSLAQVRARVMQYTRLASRGGEAAAEKLRYWTDALEQLEALQEQA